MAPAVSFVVATYGRPEVLEATLRALVLQCSTDWEAVVVGDCCDARTEAAVRRVADRRIRYYNLPARYGEQGGPNSVGLAVARGGLVTFCNHDDLLLSDHLDHVLTTFGEGGVEVVVSRLVRVRWFELLADGTPKVVCGELAPRRVRAADAIGYGLTALEPSSAWTVTAEVARRVGPWHSSQSLRRLPFQDWVLRLARETRRWSVGDRVTGLSLVGSYATATPEALDLVELLTRWSPDDVRATFVPEPEPRLRPAMSARVVQRLDDLVAPLGLVVHRATGFDYGPLPARLGRHGRGLAARHILENRTGEAMPDHSALARYLADPESLRVV